jgi:hypothetical protein
VTLDIKHVFCQKKKKKRYSACMQWKEMVAGKKSGAYSASMQ